MNGRHRQPTHRLKTAGFALLVAVLLVVGIAASLAAPAL